MGGRLTSHECSMLGIKGNQTYSDPNGGGNDGDFHPMGSQSVKNHKKKQIQEHR